jgi:LysR family transcriptional activator of nhaA
MADLSLNELDLVISDTPLSPTTKTRAFDYLLGESTVSILGTAELKEKLSGKFPESLDGAPMVFPGGASTLRRSLDRWCDQKKLFPAVVAEVQDSGLRNIMAQSGIGLVPVPGLVDDEVASRYSLVKIGEISDITEQFYAMAADRRIQHPGVQAVAENSQKRLVSAI